MNVSDYIFEKARGLIKRVPEIRDEGLGYTAANDGSTEAEVGEFLHAMVRLTKPRMVLETGTYVGLSSSYMAQGLKDNALGHLDTIEIDQSHIDTSTQLWRQLDLLPWITSHHMRAEDFTPQCKYDMIFLDSEPDIRFGELVKFFPYLTPGGYVFIHDLHQHMGQETIPGHDFAWPFGKLPDQIKQWSQDDELRAFHFKSPRGFTGYYKPTMATYRFK